MSGKGKIKSACLDIAIIIFTLLFVGVGWLFILNVMIPNGG